MWRKVAIGVLALGACDGASGAPGSSDAASDAPDEVRGEISVVVEVSDEQPEVERSVVVFNDRAGAIIDVGFLDSTGRAIGEVTEGGSVTVIWPAASRNDFTTVLGVGLGEEIRIAQVLPQESLLGYVQVSFTPDPGAMSHGVRLCGGAIGAQPGESSVSIGLGPSCTSDLIDVTVFSITADGVFKYITSPNRLAMPGGMLQIDGQYSPLETFTATLQGIPADVGRAGSAMMQFENGRFLEDHAGSFEAPEGGVALSEMRYAPGGDTMRVRSVFQLADAQAYQQIEETILPSPSLESTLTLLPWVLGATVDSAEGTVEITTQGEGSADVAYAEFVTGASEGLSLVWRIIAPGTERILVIPDLPPPYDQLRPIEVEPDRYVSGALFSVEGAGGYAALRPVFFDVMGRYPRDWEGATFSMSGGGPYW